MQRRIYRGRYTVVEPPIMAEPLMIRAQKALFKEESL